MLERINAEVKKFKKKNGGICAFSVLGVDPADSYTHNHGACHYELVNIKNKFDGDAAYVVNYLAFEKTKDEEVLAARIAFLDWLVNKSVWRHAFTMREEFPLDSGVLVSPCTISTSYLMAAQMQTRAGRENSGSLLNWHNLVKAGVNEEMAAVLSEYRTTIKDGNIEISKKMDGTWGHTSWNQVDKERFVDTLKGRINSNDFGKNAEQYSTLRTYGYTVILDTCGERHYGKDLEYYVYNKATALIKEVEVDGKDHFARPIKIKVKRLQAEDLNKLWEQL